MTVTSKPPSLRISRPANHDDPGPSSRGYSPRLSDELEVVDGPLVDFTEQDPSYAWAAGAAVSNLEDLARFLRALLGGELLPPELIAELLTTVPVPTESVPLALYDRYGLGIVEIVRPPDHCSADAFSRRAAAVVAPGWRAAAPEGNGGCVCADGVGQDRLSSLP